ncbi:MAG: putative tricarboxylic transport membrane protein [Planctomycetota bacterium]|jgi:putative tricarboxylic transport membrane protein
MNMETAFSSLLLLATDPHLVVLILLAVPVGMFFGVVPGLGGKLGIVLCIPFVFDMDTTSGAVFLLSMHAVVHTGGSIPSILFGIPGTGPDAATIMDGYPLAKRGEAGRALGASLSASAFGGVIGALMLIIMLPIMEPIILAFSPAEFFLLAILGITFIAALSGDSLQKGLIIGCLGLMLSFVGLSPQTGEPRYTFGMLFLWDGVDLISAVLAIFAIPEMIDLGVKGGAISNNINISSRYHLREVITGMLEVFRYRWLALRTSIIGVILGAIPGIGGDAASWICYGHAVQSSKTPEQFGKGAIAGVIAPETANNSKEAGSLLPTLFFGVPGSSGMALLLGAFIMLGIEPGPQMIINNQSLLWTLIWALILSNIIAVLMFLIIAPQLSLVATIRGALLIPLVMVLAILGSYLSSGDWRNWLFMLILGIFGYGFKIYNWPRSPLVVGLVLGIIAENSLNQSLAIWGPAFLLRPASLILILLILTSIAFYCWRTYQRRGAINAD